LMPGKAIRIQEIVDAFVSVPSSQVAQDSCLDGDPQWAGHSLDSMKTVIKNRIETRIGAGPDQHRRVWKYFARDKASTLSLASFRKQLRTDLNLNLSELMCQQLVDGYSLSNGGTLNFAEFVSRVMGYSTDPEEHPSSLVPVQGLEHVSHSTGNSEMFVRNKVRSCWHELTTAFKRADRDASGSLPVSAVARILRRFAIDLTPQQFVDFLRDIDADDDRTAVKYRQFLSLFEAKEATGRNPRQSLASMGEAAAVQTMVDKVQLKFSGSYNSSRLRRAFKDADVKQNGLVTTMQMTDILTEATELQPTHSQIIAVRAPR